jgi:nucleotide-binding universal stress UspA family protein
MTFKDILTPILSVAGDVPALDAAVLAAVASKGRVSALLLSIQLESVLMGEGFASGSIVDDYMKALDQQYVADKTFIEQRVRGCGVQVSAERLFVSYGQIDRGVARRARASDLVVLMSRGESWQRDLRTPTIEGALLGSGRPVLLVPPDWSGKTLGKRLLVAWNGSREAARALSDSGSLLAEAEHVRVICVNGEDDVSAMTATAHLARRDVSAEADDVRCAGGSEVETLLDAAAKMSADLIVMGGYGRSRLSETVFGGMTRAMLHDASLHILMSH